MGSIRSTCPGHTMFSAQIYGRNWSGVQACSDAMTTPGHETNYDGVDKCYINFSF